MGVFLSIVLFSSASNATIRRQLIVIGYASEQYEGNNVLYFSHYHYPVIADKTEQTLRSLFQGFNFKEVNKNIFESDSEKVTILNANVVCPGESAVNKNQRFSLCTEQMELSKKIKFYIQNHMAQFDEFYYIGHSRLGMGLGLGPFVEEYTLPIKFYNSSELGNIKKILLASCDSYKYFYDKIFMENDIEFKAINGQKLWLEDQLNFIVSDIVENHLSLIGK